MHISQGALTRTSTVAIRAATGRRLTAKLSGPLGWLSSLQPRVMAMLECLPPQLQELERSDEAIQDALFRCFDREVTAALRVFQKVESDLKTLSNVCAGREMFTNTTRDLAHHVETGIPPKHWITAAAHKTPPDLSLVDWVLDFCYRVAQLAIIGTGNAKATLFFLKKISAVRFMLNVFVQNSFVFQTPNDFTLFVCRVWRREFSSYGRSIAQISESCSSNLGASGVSVTECAYAVDRRIAVSHCFLYSNTATRRAAASVISG